MDQLKKKPSETKTQRIDMLVGTQITRMESYDTVIQSIDWWLSDERKGVTKQIALEGQPLNVTYERNGQSKKSRTIYQKATV